MRIIAGLALILMAGGCVHSAKRREFRRCVDSANDAFTNGDIPYSLRVDRVRGCLNAYNGR